MGSNSRVQLLLDEQRLGGRVITLQVSWRAAKQFAVNDILKVIRAGDSSTIQFELLSSDYRPNPAPTAGDKPPPPPADEVVFLDADRRRLEDAFRAEREKRIKAEAVVQALEARNVALQGEIDGVEARVESVLESILKRCPDVVAFFLSSVREFKARLRGDA